MLPPEQSCDPTPSCFHFGAVCECGMDEKKSFMSPRQPKGYGYEVAQMRNKGTSPSAGEYPETHPAERYSATQVNVYRRGPSARGYQGQHAWRYRGDPPLEQPVERYTATPIDGCRSRPSAKGYLREPVGRYRGELSQEQPAERYSGTPVDGYRQGSSAGGYLGKYRGDQPQERLAESYHATPADGYRRRPPGEHGRYRRNRSEGQQTERYPATLDDGKGRGSPTGGYQREPNGRYRGDKAQGQPKERYSATPVDGYRRGPPGEPHGRYRGNASEGQETERYPATPDDGYRRKPPAGGYHGEPAGRYRGDPSQKHSAERYPVTPIDGNRRGPRGEAHWILRGKTSEGHQADDGNQRGPPAGGYQEEPAGRYRLDLPQLQQAERYHALRDDGYGRGTPLGDGNRRGPPAVGYHGEPVGRYRGDQLHVQLAVGYHQGDVPSSSLDNQLKWKKDVSFEDEVSVDYEVSDEDVEDDPNAAPTHTAQQDPSQGTNDDVSGYTIGSIMPPPSFDNGTRQPPPARQRIQMITQTLTEEEARQALLEMVAEHCCYGKGAAQDMRFNTIKDTSAFHYTLETFGESRSTAWAYEPYRNQPIDGPQNGPAPGPWDIKRQPKKVFENQKVAVEVPHTASVKPCHTCLAKGEVQCDECSGRGTVSCIYCAGRGFFLMYGVNEGTDHEDKSICVACSGTGRMGCLSCHRHGMIKCTKCRGTCKLKCYIQLSIHWTNHLNDHIVDQSDVPDYLIRCVSGKVAFEETSKRVWPVNHFPDFEVNNASQRLVSQHSTEFSKERLLMQRHRVKIIPICQLFYTWKKEQSDFFVYGFEKRVFAPSYPQQCCCGCEIL